jgi:hypothetical protein
MNIVGTLIGIDSLKVAHMSDDVVFVYDAVASEHITGISGNLEGLSTVVALDHGDHLGGESSLLVFQARHACHSMKAQSDLSAHVSHLFLHELRLSEGLAELLAVKGVFTGSVEAELSCTHGSPGNTESGLVEAAERPLETLDIKDVLLGDLHIVHHDHTGDGGPQ